jgi:membrane-bound metal-dependent hydrolase YbcI (DUF457 family)
LSITAHYTEQFILKRHFSYLNFKWLIVGSAFPDGFILDRLFIFSIDIRMHRDYLFGYSHTLFLPLATAIIVYYLFSKSAAISFLIGAWLHVFHDVFDEIGVKLLWPFMDVKYSIGIWPWTDGSILNDVWTYYITPASGLFELFFFVWAVMVVRKVKGRNIGRKIMCFWKSSDWIRNNPRSISFNDP